MNPQEEAEAAKAKSKSVSLPPEVWALVEDKAAAEYGGNRSAYLRELIDADQRKKALPAGIMVDLTQRLLGEVPAEEMASLLGNDDQRVHLSAMLREYLARRTSPVASWIAASEEIALRHLAEQTKRSAPGGRSENTSTDPASSGRKRGE